jgi:DNA-directed RNA polymerase III subunit RPC8
MWIPLVYLPQPCALYVSLFSFVFKAYFYRCIPSSDPNERAYFWLPGSEATSTHELLDSPVTERLYIDQGEIVRVRVERDEFCDEEPGPPKATEGVLISGEARRLPYTVTVSLRYACDAKHLFYALRFSALSPNRGLGQ